MDKSRQKFEYWYFNNHSHEQKYPLHRDDSGEYYYEGTRKAWVSWQASRESLINNLEPVGYIGAISLLRIRRNEKSYIYPDNNIKTIPLYRLDK